MPFRPVLKVPSALPPARASLDSPAKHTQQQPLQLKNAIEDNLQFYSVVQD